jgi:hypothetical protein
MQGNRSDSGIIRSGPEGGGGARRRLHRTALLGALVLALGLFALIGGAAASAASPYPPNTVISTYVDPRYGVVSVVTDQWGNLINVNAATGQRIYPVYADYGPWGGYVAPNYVNGYYGYNGVYVQPNYVNGAYPYYGYSPYYGYTGVYRAGYTVVAPNGTPYVLGAPYRVK